MKGRTVIDTNCQSSFGPKDTWVQYSDLLPSLPYKNLTEVWN